MATHDVARPLTSDALIERVFKAAGWFDAVIPTNAVTATLKRVADTAESSKQGGDPLDVMLGGAGGTNVAARCVGETIGRKDLVEVQSPQVFQLDLLRWAYDRIRDGQICVVEGKSTNVKITRPEDMKLAEALATLSEREKSASLGAKPLFGANDEE